MASLLGNTTISEFSQVLEDHFDTFKRSITVHREPIKSVTNVQNNPLHGYGESAETNNVSYIPQKKTFDAIITFENKQSESTTQVGTLEAGMVRIKVKQDAADYIKGGKVEKIDVDGKTFNKITDDKIQNYLGSVFYIFYLQATT
tara:strand:- start:995 stop:1429 length:435 start_codon:yes stop_codon:yes gene_type:complete